MDAATIPGPTGPLPRGWHRVTWTSHGKPKWVVTQCVSSATDLHISLYLLAGETSWLEDVWIEHWMPASLTTRP